MSKWAKMDKNYTFWNFILLFCVHFFQNQSKFWLVNQKHLWKERGAQKFRLDNVTKSVICTCMVALHFSTRWTWHDFDYYLYTAVSHLIFNNFSRKVGLQKWFYKLGFFSGQPLFSNQKKIRVCRTTFLQPEKKSEFAGPLF